MREEADTAELPSLAQLRRAIEVYLDCAYEDGPPAVVRDRLPGEDADVPAWLMGDAVERNPADAPDIRAVRSFALRLGNATYPHMKLRLSRPPRDGTYLFSVDAHDAFLHAPAGTPDHDALAALKRRNAEIAAEVARRWQAEGVPTERDYLRAKIRQARNGRGPVAS